MPNRTNLDIDFLRTFVLGFELGSFARAAERIGRSQSTVSAQLRKLEEQIGQPLVKKAGRGLALTEAGDSLLSYARRIVDLNDQAVETVGGPELEGWVRLGLPQDFAEAWLPDVLGRFQQTHPKMRIEVRAEKVTSLVEKTVLGELDLSLAWGAQASAPHAEHVADVPIVWVGKAGETQEVVDTSTALPLITFEPPCAFRDPAASALDAAGIAWRVSFTSPSLSSLWAAAAAGLGLTVRTRVGLPSTLQVLDPAQCGLPSLPAAPLYLVRAESEPTATVQVFGDVLLNVVRSQLEDLV